MSLLLYASWAVRIDVHADCERVLLQKGQRQSAEDLSGRPQAGSDGRADQVAAGAAAEAPDRRCQGRPRTHAVAVTVCTPSLAVVPMYPSLLCSTQAWISRLNNGAFVPQVAALVALVRELRLELFSLKKAEQVLDGLLKEARPPPTCPLQDTNLCMKAG